ncbi:tRNA (guanine-N(7)-)-methyltransferase [Buchnera aphidicola (Cinara kochiana kochiana)]|uniref:tRNA (guanine-N(7)-)-methyltransferase n=1 Tax=Buchnera aphidicola (Cinara kochiana kochiana) TaxID=2518976 RepID=A0A451D617_9GAMM|nr:tRNA (guanosine(46)-N7)-methyltransferase TrmB [Buchnera aphidicola]VFP81268.1 tRNA (guanine-N(7)-)-methyltransferase [Buchnera aphidicola (Cinara kochiana kochiana)]
MIISTNDLFCKKNITCATSIKSYVTRQRNVKIQKIEHITICWKIYGINFNSVQLNFLDLFPIKQPIIIEIGFGDGKLFIEKAINNPHVNFIGIEVYLKGVLTAIQYAYINNITNIKLICYDAVEILKYMIPNRAVNIFQIFFPDPWFKTKHRKRRLINDCFIDLILNKIINKGFLHIITDCPLYSKQIYNTISLYSSFKRIFSGTVMFPLVKIQKDTKFKKKALFLKKNIFDYKYQFNLK